jgi:hypothetical protein
MTHHLAQLNIARFRLPQEHSDNAGFVSNLDRINQIAEQQDGFVWRLKDDGNNALDISAFDDPNIVSNMSLWTSIEALGAFVYRNGEHREIMRRRHEWFDKVDFYLVLWWVEAGQKPSLDDAKARLKLLERIGPSEKAFTFKKPFSAPSE